MKTRYHLLDNLRGITLISMILYHAMWDIVYIFGVDAPWYRTEGAYIWQQSICWTFILLSGFCWSLGKKHLKRGLTVFGLAWIITAVTVVLMPENKIMFGVLCLLGSAMLLMIPLDKLFRRINPYMGIVITFVLFLFTKRVPDGYLGVGDWQLLQLPRAWYANSFTAYLGFPHTSFTSTDYFPILPWFFLFVTGYFLYHIWKRCNKSSLLEMRGVAALAFIGRHSLIIYALHQPVVYGVLYLWFEMFS